MVIITHRKKLWLQTILLAGFLTHDAAGQLRPLFADFQVQTTEGCTIGVAKSTVTQDARPLLWKVRDTSPAAQQLVYASGSPYDYIGVRSQGGSIFMGINEAGVATGNSLVSTPGGTTSNASFQRHILENYSSQSQINSYIQSEVQNGTCNASGCFPFIDAGGEAVIYEINRSDWFIKYSSTDPDRQPQGLLGFVVRANEFHQRTDGTDDVTITGRYQSGTFNISGLVGLDELSACTVTQGNDGPNRGYEFVRYGPGRSYASISRDSNQSTIVVHGVAAGEDPALTTMWVILGQSNYGIAVPSWAKVSNIPGCLSSGDMYDCALSLYNAGHEATTQGSTFPVEAHMFNVVNNKLLPHWRNEGTPSKAEMTRIEHQMADDAYSLLFCLAYNQSDNRAPEPNISITAVLDTVKFTSSAHDSDGVLVSATWDFGDEETSDEISPLHTYAAPGTYLVSCSIEDDDGVSITDWGYCQVPGPIPGDSEPDGDVDIMDLAFFSLRWLRNDCDAPDWCDRADMNFSHRVDIVDFALMAQYWMWVH